MKSLNKLANKETPCFVPIVQLKQGNNWKNITVMNVFRSQNTRKSTDHRRTELLRKVHKFLEYYFGSRVKSSGTQRITNLSFILRCWAGISRKILIRLTPALHFSRQQTQFFFNQILYSHRNKDGDNRVSFHPAKEVLKWIPATKNRMQQGPIINRFIDSRVSLAGNRYLSLKQERGNNLPWQFTGIKSLAIKVLKFIQTFNKTDVLQNLKNFERFVKSDLETLTQQSRSQIPHFPSVPLRRG